MYEEFYSKIILIMRQKIMNITDKDKLARIGANLWGTKNRQEKLMETVGKPKRQLATDIDFVEGKLEDKQPDILAKDFAGCIKGARQIYKDMCLLV